jgi:hypothetical protein
MTPESRAGTSNLEGFIDAPENRAVTCHLMRKLKQPLDAMLMQRTTLLVIYIASNSSAYTAAATRWHITYTLEER